MDPVRRWFASEISMSLTVTGILDTKRIQRGSEGRVDHDRTGKGGGGGLELLLDVNQEVIRRHEFEGGGRGALDFCREE